MGCDIHAYIDYDDFKTKDGDWRASCFARVVDNGWDYTLFALMAGVRYDPRTDAQFKPMFEPRGLPDRVSWAVSEQYTLRITDNEDWHDDERFCSKADAQRRVGRGISEWMDEEHTLISHPGWHSASWLTANELESVADAFERIEFPEQSWFQIGSPEDQPAPENATATKTTSIIGSPEWYVEVGEKKTRPAPATLKGIVAAMQELDGDQPGRSRLVFWFDN